MQGAAAVAASQHAIKRKKEKRNDIKYQKLDASSYHEKKPLQPSYLTPIVPQPYRIRSDSEEQEIPSIVSGRRPCKANMNYIAYFVFCIILFFVAVSQLSPGKICYQNQYGGYMQNGIQQVNLTAQSCSKMLNANDDGLPDLEYSTIFKNSSTQSPFHLSIDGGWSKRNTTFHMIGCVLSFVIGLWIALGTPTIQYRQLFWFSICVAWLIALILDVTSIKQWNKDYCQHPAKDVIHSLVSHMNSADQTIVKSFTTVTPLVEKCKIQNYQYTSLLVVICFICSFVLFIITILERKLDKLKDEPETHYTMLVEEEEGRGAENVVHI